MISFLQYFMIVVLVLLGFQTSGQSVSEAAPLQEPGSISRSDYQSAREFQSLSRQWQSVVEADENNASAWLNWFEAERLSNFEGKRKTTSPEEKQNLQQIVDGMESKVSTSAEYRYAQFLMDPYSENSFPHLLSAEEKSAEIEKFGMPMAAYGKITGNTSILKEYCRKIKASRIFSQAEMEYNYNVLMSVPKDAILFTHGDADTYPLLILQELENVRQDVKVVNIEWLNNTGFRNKIAQEAGVSLSMEKDDFYKWIESFIASSSDPVALPLTFPNDFLTGQQLELYCTGLVFQTQPDPEMKQLEDNWSQFQLAHFDDSSGILKNYKVPLYILDQHLAAKMENDKRKSLEPFKEYFPDLFPAEK